MDLWNTSNFWTKGRKIRLPARSKGFVGLSSDEEILLMLKIRINKSEHSAEYFRYSCWKMFYFVTVFSGKKLKIEKIETCLFLFFYFLLFCVIARCVVKSPLSLSDHKCANTVLLEVIPKADCITEEMMIIFLFYLIFLSQKLTRVTNVSSDRFS